MTIQFKGRVAIVTGAGRGIGRSHALELARRGAKVVINDLGGDVNGRGANSEAAEEVVAEIKKGGGEAFADGASVTDADAMARLAQRTLERFGRIDILINNAGILRDKSFGKMPVEDFRAIIDVHVLGSTYLTHACWTAMKDQKYGRIVFTSSPAGLYGHFGNAAYCTGKAAVVGLMNALKIEGAKDNIRVNTIAPVAASRMTENLVTPERFEAMNPNHVTAGVMCLVAEDAPTGLILVAGSGVFAEAQVFQSEGLGLSRGSLNADVVHANWGRITDMTTASAIPSGAEAGTRMLSKGVN